MRTRAGQVGWLTGAGERAGCEALEPRALLMAGTADLPFVAFFPEGFASAQINEFVPITNPHDVPVRVQLHARYEFGDRDEFIGEQIIPARSRGGFTVSDAAAPHATIVRQGVPYSLIVLAERPVAAQFSHYDFGTAVGEPFTSETSTLWAFPDGMKDPAGTRDFILVYNPNPFEVEATLVIYSETGFELSTMIRIAAERRGGWSVNDIAEFPGGAFGAVVEASGPVVASHTHYELRSGRGFAMLGDPRGGAFAGVVPSLGYDDAFYDTNGDDNDPATPRFDADSIISILNAGSFDAVVTMLFVFDDTDLGVVSQSFEVPGASVRQLSVRELGFQSGDEFGLLWESNSPISVAATVFQGMDGTGAVSATRAATVWDFGEGYMSRLRGGGAVLEDVHIFNPNPGPVDVTITLFFTDGTTQQYTDVLDGRELVSARLDTYGPLRDRADDSFFGIRLVAFQPVVAMFEHWDAGNGGGFTSFGIPGGTVRDLARFTLVG